MYIRLKYLRINHNPNQTQVSKMLGMSQTGYSKYETGENDLPTAVLIKLADYYDTSIDYILGRTDCRDAFPRIITQSAGIQAKATERRKKAKETNVTTK